ncbi:hypothetical protein Tco_1399836 [Tanacetum coccineum]
MPEENLVMCEKIKAYTQGLKKVKHNVLTYHKKLLAKAQKEKDDLEVIVDKWNHSSKNLGKIVNSHMSARDKFGLGYGDYRYSGILSYENEVLQSVFKGNNSDFENLPLHKRLGKTCEMQAVPPPMTGNYLPSGPDIEIDDSQYTYGPAKTQPSESESQTTELDTCDSNISTEPSELVSEPVVNESNVEVQPKVWSDAPIIEEYESDSDDEYVSVQTKGLDTPSFANKQVKTPRENVKNQSTHSQKPKVNNKELGNGFTERTCFVCGSFSHLIRDCDYHVKLAKQVELNKHNMSKGNGTRERKQSWNNVQRVNKQNQFVPLAVQTKTGNIPVNTAKASGTNNFSTARQNVNRQTVLTSTALKVNTVKPMWMELETSKEFIIKLIQPYYKAFKRNNRNKAYLADFQDFNGGHVAFGGSKGYITGKGKIKTGKGPNWLIDLDYLTDSMNYHSVRSENQANLHAGQQESNQNTGTKDKIGAGDSDKVVETEQDCFELPIWHSYSSTKKGSPREEEQVFLDDLENFQMQEKEANEEAEALRKNLEQETENLVTKAEAAKSSSTNIFSTVSTTAKASGTNLVNTVSIPFKSKKIAQVVRAWIQSKNSLVKHFEDMRLCRPFKESLHVWFNPPRDVSMSCLTTKGMHTIRMVYTRSNWESQRRAPDGAEAFLILTLFILSLDKVSTDHAKLVPLGKVCTAKESLEKNTAKGTNPVVSTTFVEQFWTSAKSKTINNVRHITAKVAGKVVSISEASIRTDLIFDDADGIDTLPNQAIFNAIQLMGYEGDLNRQLANISVPLDHFPVNSLTSKVFSFMIKKGKHFSGKVTPLFDTMLVQPAQDEGASSERLSVEQPSPSPTPTGEIPNESLPDSSSAQPSEVPFEHHPDTSPSPSPRPSPTPIVLESTRELLETSWRSNTSNDASFSGNEDDMTLQNVYDLCISLCQQVLDQAKEIKLLKAKIKKLKKKAKPNVSKQGRKKAKGESSVQRDLMFEVLAEDKNDHMETENPQTEGRTRDMVEEEKEFDEERLSTEDEVSTVKEGVSTDFKKVSTDRPKVSTDESKVSTNDQVEGTESKVSTDDQMKGTEDETKEEIASKASQTSTQTPTSMTFGDDETIATLLINMSKAKAASKEKEKCVELKDVEEIDRPKPTSTRSLLTLKPLPKN